MANISLGKLDPGEVIGRNGFLQRQGPGIRTDTYTFRTGTIVANVAISVDSFTDRDVGLVLFRDNDANGLINSADTVVANAGQTSTFESVNPALTQGNYIARIVSTLDTGYNVRIARGTSGAANPLAGPEISLGTLSQDLRKRDRVNDDDTADNFAFTLGSSDSLNIAVREIGRKQGDVNIRVVRDLNGNGVVDDGEIVALGSSSGAPNTHTITGLNGAGDYVLQVCQTQGDTRFHVNFDHSAA